MISILRFMGTLPLELKREVNKLLKEAEAANGHPFIRNRYSLLKSSAEFIRDNNGMINQATMNDFLRRYNPSEMMIIQGLLTAKSEEDTKNVQASCQRELMKTRKSVREAIQQVCPAELKAYDKEQKKIAKENKQIRESRKPRPQQAGCSRPMFPPQNTLF